MASEIRVNKIENRSGLGTVTFADTGVDLAGIVTATTFSGSGASLTALPAAQLSGTLPAISAANLTNVPAANITGTLPAISATNLTNVPAANVVGVHTSLNITGSTTTGTVVVGGGVTISESGIEASGIGITCANINGGSISGRRNLVINGAMQVAQRGDTASVTGGYGGCDRFRFDRDGASAVTLKQGGSGVSPVSEGFSNSQHIDITTADTSMGGTNFNILSTRFEGQNLQMIRKGTSAAQELTLSFYIKSTVTGTYIAELYDVDNSRQCSKAYTISSSNTWEKKEITFPADTTGTFGIDANRSMEINWWFGAGPTYTGGTLNTSWASANNANRAVGQVNAVNSTSNDIYLTGVQLELGSQATAFEHRSFAEERLLCKRYYHQLPTTDTQGSVGGYLFLSKPAYYESEGYYFPVEMRAAPTVTTSNTWILRAYGASSNTAASEVINSRVERFYVTSSASNTNNSYVWIVGADTNYPLKMDAEL